MTANQIINAYIEHEMFHSKGLGAGEIEMLRDLRQGLQTALSSKDSERIKAQIDKAVQVGKMWGVL